MSEENKDILTEELPTRKNPFCVISKATYGDYAVRDIQTNSAWGANPYDDTFAVVPDEMVEGIKETHGFCDIELSDDGTEVVSFVEREIPDIPEEEPEPTQMDRIEAQVTYTALMTDTLI